MHRFTIKFQFEPKDRELDPNDDGPLRIDQQSQLLPINEQHRRASRDQDFPLAIKEPDYSLGHVLLPTTTGAPLPLRRRLPNELLKELADSLPMRFFAGCSSYRGSKLRHAHDALGVYVGLRYEKFAKVKITMNVRVQVSVKSQGMYKLMYVEPWSYTNLMHMVHGCFPTLDGRLYYRGPDGVRHFENDLDVIQMLNYFRCQLKTETVWLEVMGHFELQHLGVQVSVKFRGLLKLMYVDPWTYTELMDMVRGCIPDLDGKLYYHGPGGARYFFVNDTDVNQMLVYFQCHIGAETVLLEVLENPGHGVAVQVVEEELAQNQGSQQKEVGTPV